MTRWALADPRWTRLVLAVAVETPALISFRREYRTEDVDSSRARTQRSAQAVGVALGSRANGFRACRMRGWIRRVRAVSTRQAVESSVGGMRLTQEAEESVGETREAEEDDLDREGE